MPNWPGGLAPETYLKASKAAEPVQGLNNQQALDIAVSMAITGNTFEQAAALIAARVAPAAIAAHKVAVTKIAATKNDAHPELAALVR